MRKIFALAFVAAAALASCKDSEKPKQASGFAGPDAVTVAYDSKTGGANADKAVDLRTLFKADGVDGNFEFEIVSQPEYSDPSTLLNGEATTVKVGTDLNDRNKPVADIFTIDADGHTLRSTDVRVWDALDGGTISTTRQVFPGKVRVTLKVADVVKTYHDFNIEQTERPALTYKINFDKSLIARDANSRTWSTTKTWDGTGTKPNGVQLKGENLFNIEPMDFSELGLVAMAGPGAGSYITVVDGQPYAGSDEGTGSYVIGFYVEPQGENETLEAYNVRKQAAYDAAKDKPETPRVYIEVTDAPVLVGIELHPNIGVWRNRSFVNRGGSSPLQVQVPASRMVIAIFNDGSRQHGELAGISADIIAGNLSGKGDATPAFEGVVGTNASVLVGTNNTLESDAIVKTNGLPIKIFGGSWFGTLGTVKTTTTTPGVVNPDPSVFNANIGDPVKFTVTHKQHFMEPDWTFEITQTIKDYSATWPTGTEAVPAAK